MGVLREVDRIEAGALSADLASGPVVLLVRAATGDEEVGAAGIDLKGVLLCHTVPHLSHLGNSLASGIVGALASVLHCSSSCSDEIGLVRLAGSCHVIKLLIQAPAYTCCISQA